MKGFLEKIKNYLKETLSELKKMNFITPQETLKQTSEVIFFTLFFFFFFAVVDLLFLIFILNLK